MSMDSAVKKKTGCRRCCLWGMPLESAAAASAMEVVAEIMVVGQVSLETAVAVVSAVARSKDKFNA